MLAMVVNFALLLLLWFGPRSGPTGLLSLLLLPPFRQRLIGDPLLLGRLPGGACGAAGVLDRSTGDRDALVLTGVPQPELTELDLLLRCT